MTNHDRDYRKGRLDARLYRNRQSVTRAYQRGYRNETIRAALMFWLSSTFIAFTALSAFAPELAPWL